MQSVLPEDRRYKETEERRGKHEETIMVEDKKRQCLNICSPKQ